MTMNVMSQRNKTQQKHRKWMARTNIPFRIQNEKKKMNLSEWFQYFFFYILWLLIRYEVMLLPLLRLKLMNYYYLQKDSFFRINLPNNIEFRKRNNLKQKKQNNSGTAHKELKITMNKMRLIKNEVKNSCTHKDPFEFWYLSFWKPSQSTKI